MSISIRLHNIFNGQIIVTHVKDSSEISVKSFVERLKTQKNQLKFFTSDSFLSKNKIIKITQDTDIYFINKNDLYQYSSLEKIILQLFDSGNIQQGKVKAKEYITQELRCQEMIEITSEIVNKIIIKYKNQIEAQENTLTSLSEEINHIFQSFPLGLNQLKKIELKEELRCGEQKTLSDLINETNFDQWKTECLQAFSLMQKEVEAMKVELGEIVKEREALGRGGRVGESEIGRQILVDMEKIIEEMEKEEMEGIREKVKEMNNKIKERKEEKEKRVEKLSNDLEKMQQLQKKKCIIKREENKLKNNLSGLQYPIEFADIYKKCLIEIERRNYFQYHFNTVINEINNILMNIYHFEISKNREFLSTYSKHIPKTFIPGFFTFNSLEYASIRKRYQCNLLSNSSIQSEGRSSSYIPVSSSSLSYSYSFSNDKIATQQNSQSNFEFQFVNYLPFQFFPISSQSKKLKHLNYGVGKGELLASFQNQFNVHGTTKQEEMGKEAGDAEEMEILPPLASDEVTNEEDELLDSLYPTLIHSNDEFLILFRFLEILDEFLREFNQYKLQKTLSSLTSSDPTQIPAPGSFQSGSSSYSSQTGSPSPFPRSPAGSESRCRVNASQQEAGASLPIPPLSPTPPLSSTPPLAPSPCDAPDMQVIINENLEKEAKIKQLEAELQQKDKENQELKRKWENEQKHAEELQEEKEKALREEKEKALREEKEKALQEEKEKALREEKEKALRKQREESELEILQLKQEKSQWEEDKLQLKEEILQLKQEKSQWEEDKLQLKQEKSQWEEDKLQLKQEKSQWEEEKSQWEEDKLQLKEEILQLKQEKSQWEEEKSQWEKEKEEGNKKADAGLLQIKENMEKELNSSKQELETMKQKLRELEEKSKTEKQNVVQYYKSQLETVQCEYERAISTRIILENELTKVKEENKNNKTLLDKASKDNEELKKYLQKQIDDLQEEVNKHERTIKEKDKEIEIEKQKYDSVVAGYSAHHLPSETSKIELGPRLIELEYENSKLKKSYEELENIKRDKESLIQELEHQLQEAYAAMAS